MKHITDIKTDAEFFAVNNNNNNWNNINNTIRINSISVHQNYVGIDNEKIPFFLSVVMSDNQVVPMYRAILFRKTGAQKMSLPYPAQNKLLTVKQILANFPGMERVDKGPREITAPDIQKDLLLLEEQEGSVNFKFGVVYMKPGQTTDDEMLSNGKCDPVSSARPGEKLFKFWTPTLIPRKTSFITV